MYQLIERFESASTGHDRKEDVVQICEEIHQNLESYILLVEKVPFLDYPSNPSIDKSLNFNPKGTKEGAWQELNLLRLAINNFNQIKHFPDKIQDFLEKIDTEPAYNGGTMYDLSYKDRIKFVADELEKLGLNLQN